MNLLQKLNKPSFMLAAKTLTKNSLSSLFKYKINNYSNKTFYGVGFKSNSLFSYAKFSFCKKPAHQKLKMPTLSPTMTKGNIVEWKKKEGDKLIQGDIVCSIETDKATVDFEVNEEGFLAKIVYPAGSKDISIGDIVAIVVDEKESIGAFKDYKPEIKQAEAVSEIQQVKPDPVKRIETLDYSKHAVKKEPGKIDVPEKIPDHIAISPLARKTAAEKKIDYTKVRGTGPRGRITYDDILAYAGSGAAAGVASTTSAGSVASANQQIAPQQTPTAQVNIPATSATNTYQDIEVTNIRRVIADRLLQSKTTIPHFYVSVECNMDKCLKLREQLNKHSSSKISVNDMVIKAASLACVKIPETNSSWMGTSIRTHTNVDMSVAVQTDNGLITPIVFNSNLKGLSEIAANVKGLAEKAKANKLQPKEFVGGTFTISNLGMFGVTSFSAIINPPQSCILAVGRAEKKVVFDETSQNKEEPYKVINNMSCTLSCDHRVVDGAVAAKWVQEFKFLMENPEMMLL